MLHASRQVRFNEVLPTYQRHEAPSFARVGHFCQVLLQRRGHPQGVHDDRTGIDFRSRARKAMMADNVEIQNVADRLPRSE